MIEGVLFRPSMRPYALALWGWTLGAGALPVYHCPHVADSIVVDGVLNDRLWQGLDTLRLVTNDDPSGNVPAKTTEVLAAWGDSNLYFAFITQDPDVEGTITQHDGDLYDHNVVETFVDPDGDGLNYIELEWNCLNTVLDYEFAAPETGLNAGWAPAGMRSAVKVHGTANHSADVDTGMVVEVSLPWSSLKPFSKGPMPPQPGDTLAINFYRIDYSTNSNGDLSAWSPTGAANFHIPSMFGRFVFAAPVGVATPPAGENPDWISVQAGMGGETLRYRLTQSDHVEAALFGLRGNRVVQILDADQGSGNHTFPLAALHLPAGWYGLACRIGTTAYRQCVRLGP